jgi:molybdenum cofactor guanylyltransferase
LSANPARAVTAIVLAGGRSSRFGSDKLRADLDGKVLIRHAIDALAPLSAEILIVLAPGVPAPVQETHGVVLVRDRRPFEGPLAGLVGGLEAAGQPIALVAGGDMPGVVPAVLERLIRALDDPAVDAAVLEADGDRPPLPMAIRVGAATAAAQDVVKRGERSLRALLRALRTSAIPESEWRQLDPTGATLRDVDLVTDL